MALNAYQTLVNQTAAKRALSGEEQARLRQIAAQQGAAAASSLALQMAQQGATVQPTQQTAIPDYVAASKAKSAANQAIVNGATAGQSVQIQNAYQKALASAQPSVSVNVPVTNRNTSSGDPVSPAVQAALGTPQPVQPTVTPGSYQPAPGDIVYQGTNRITSSGDPVSVAKLKSLGTPQPAASAGSANTGLSNAPTMNGNYVWYSWMGDNNMTTMNDQDKANWNTAMQGWQNGDYSAFNDNFQTNGNWASYVDDKGKVNGMLRYVGDGIGGYVPVNGSQLLQNGFSGDLGNYAFYGPDGSVYTADANGRLSKAGTWTADYDKAMKNGYYYNNPERYFQGKDGQFYTYADVPDDKLAEWGYVRRNDGIFYEPQTIATNKALESGQVTREQLAQAQAAQALRESAVPANLPGTAGGSAPAQNAYQQYLEQATQNTQPAQNQPASQPVQTQPTNAQPTQQQTPYQAAVEEWSYGPAPEWNGTDYERQRDEALAAAGEKWQGSDYQQLRDDALRRAEDMRWNYDPNTDPVWQALQKQYRREGDRATQEAMAQAAMRTGGLANSYAVTAASQAGDYYAAQLSDRLPQIYQDAYNRYLQEFQRQMGISDQYAGFDQTEYNRYADRLQQYNTDRNFDYGRYRDAVGDYRYDDETQYNRNYQAQRDAINDQRYDQEWAQQLREYADSQNWKATEWQQYLREYGDKMSQQEREWAYQQYRDAVEDQQYADQTAWQKAVYDQEYADQRKDKEWEQTYKQTTYNDALEDAALDYLNTNGIVTGRYAEILGVPDGTTYEQYYSRYLGGGNSSPFEETEIPSGTTPKYTPPPIDDGGDDEQPPEAPPQNDPVFQKIRSKYGEDTAMETWNLSNQPWFAKLKSVAYTNKNAALDEIYYRVEAGQISDDEMVIKALLDMLGLNEASVEYGAYGGSTGLYGTYGVKGGSNRNVNIQNLSN